MIRPVKSFTAVALAANIFLVPVTNSGCTRTGGRHDTAAASLRQAPFDNAVLMGHLENRDITEASGIAASRIHPDVLWIVNDGGNAPALYAVDMQGAYLGRLRIRNALNVDWEDLAAFRVKNTATLLIADFGDNHARRDVNHLYFVPEPDIAGHPDRFDISVDWHRRVRFVYEDGPRDCEAVAVDPGNNQILLLTKRIVPPVLYALPLKTEKEPPLMVARRLTAVENMLPAAAAPTAVYSRTGRLSSQPTAMDMTADGTEIAVLTYGNGYLFRRPAHLGWPEVFQNPPEWIRMPDLRQAEALCFTANGQTLIVTSERFPAPLYRLDRLPLNRGGIIP